MEALLIQRRSLKSKVTRIERAIASAVEQGLTATHVQLYQGKLDRLSNDMEDLQQQIAASSDEQDYDAHQGEFDDIMDRIDAQVIICGNASTSGSVTQRVNSVSDIKLPRLELPTFQGNYDNWLPFHDIFASTIHNNSSLSGAQKFQYLKSSLKGEAALLIHSIPVTDDNYPEAWDILTTRYNNRREIIDAQVSRLLNQASIQQETAQALRRLLDTTTECVRALKVLKVPVEHWDVILVHILKNKINPECRREWELSLVDQEQPTFRELSAFIDKRARALAATPPSARQVNSKRQAEFHSGVSKPSGRSTVSVHHETISATCPVCGGNHRIFRCPDFLKTSVTERKKIVRDHTLCFNCLKADHLSNECKSGHCKRCDGKHNTLLHHEETVKQSNQGHQMEQSQTISHIARNQSPIKQVFMATAIVQVKDSTGQWQSARALLDSASQTSFITERCAQMLTLQRQKASVCIAGIGASGMGTARGTVSLKIRSRLDKSKELLVQPLILTTITRPLPSITCDPGKWKHLQSLTLADPTYHRSGQVDLLLGADIYADLLEIGLCNGSPGTPSAFNTIFGWVVSGAQTTSGPNNSVSVHFTQCSVQGETDEIDKLLPRFWELEEIPQRKQRTVEEETCEQHFESTHTRHPSGQYMVRLPFRNSERNFPGSREIAVSRFLSLERRLRANPKVGAQYREFMQDYISLGHMERVDVKQVKVDTSNSFYLPHHAVIREASITTKLRVVFNASVKSHSGSSLNDELLVGPKLQDDLLNLLIRFRLHPIAMTADVIKMFRKVWVDPQDTDYQRIVWRENPQQPIQDYRLLTVTYGTASAPYLATKALQQLSKDEGHQFPLASPILLNDVYMDDLLTGAETSTAARQLQGQLIELFHKGGFQLHKWASNDPQVLESIPPEARIRQETSEIGTNNQDLLVHTLGLRWNTSLDQLSYNHNTNSNETASNKKICKRTILSDTSRVFDPLGLIAPIVVRAKLLMQELWLLKLSWDDQLPCLLAAKWNAYQEELDGIGDITVPRCISQLHYLKAYLHGFCDASEKAYAATVYLWTQSDQGKIKVQLVAAKTRVAPLKQISLPRLELCGAVLLARLIQTVQDALRIKISQISTWTDSTIVLAWIASGPQRWKAFVANRVAEIQQTVPTAQWQHVSGKENPADCASRGCTVKELLQHQLWWQGPSWIKASEVPTSVTSFTEEEIPEEKVIRIALPTGVTDSTLMRYSSLVTLQRVTAYMQRFIHNLRSPKESRLIGPLSVQELETALLHWIRVVQKQEWSPEVRCLEEGRPLHSRSKILSLQPVMDKKGIMRVGGRLRHSRLTPDRIHPILLPKKSHLTSLLIAEEHRRTFHGGPQLLMVSLQRRFWIIGARDVTRRHVKQCVQCTRQAAVTAQQMMSDLPAFRVNPTRPFFKCGVDYAGPFLLRVLKGRGQKMFKAYIAVFVCFSTRAIHLELVSDMSTEAFLAALKPFIARRGKCSDLYSDCGTNFVGADRELREFWKFMARADHNSDTSNWLAVQGIQWHFNPPGAPHFGGIWEAGVKSVKYHLKRVMSNARLNFEEMSTLLCQIEACLNSRPLTAFSSDPGDLSALTPGHFLIGDVLTAVPERDLTPIKENRLSQWQRGQQLMQHFWRRWSQEYLSRLQQRPKWLSPRKNLKPGDLVLIKESLPPTQWKLGRVQDLHPGSDGLVRVVTVKTSDGLLKRPITKLSPLPID